MKFALYTNSISPHQLPLMRELAALLGIDNVLYAYESVESKGRRTLGWNPTPEAGCRKSSECLTDIETCDTLLVGGLRPIELMEKRATVGLKTLYMSERWFKPAIGILRLLYPKYFLMAWRIVRLVRNSDSFTYLPIGIHAARDMARLCGLMAGDLRCLFVAPKLDFERKPGGKIWLKEGANGKRYCLDKMRMWGYYVEPSKFDALPVQEASESKPQEIKVLWIGRLLNLKRVDTIVRAVGEHANLKRVDNSLPKITLDIYGIGPDEARLKKMASKFTDLIKFYPPVPIADVRKLMREHDVYVLSSNAYEGWGAVLSEALEEGMIVIGTFEAGSSATILPHKLLFHAGDENMLVRLLCKITEGGKKAFGIGKWTAKDAAQALLNFQNTGECYA